MAYKGITGSVQGAGPHFDDGTLCGGNLDLSGILPPGQIGNCFASDGDLWIGSSTLTAGGTRSKIGNIVSTDGSIRVVNGSGTIDIRGQAAGFQPNAVLQEFDDFIASTENGIFSKLNWARINNSLRQVAGTINNPGIWSLEPAGGVNIGIYLNQADVLINEIGPFRLGGGTTTINWIVNLTALSSGGNTYRFSCGLSDTTTLNSNSDSFVDGVYFQYTNAVNGGQWQIKSTSSSVTTTVSTSVVTAIGFNTLTMVINAGATSISYYINNVLVGTAITTNIPTASLTPFVYATNLSGTTPEIQIDLYWMTLALSNPRPGPISPSTTGTTGRFLLNYTATPISYQVLGTDAIIGVTSTAAPRTITMPNASLTAGQIWIIKDESGGAATHNITVSGNGSNIDGAATNVIASNYGSIQLYWSGSNFFII
jgi:hypothetical protein